MTFVFVLAFLCVTAKQRTKCGRAGSRYGILHGRTVWTGTYRRRDQSGKKLWYSLCKGSFGDVKALSQVWVFLVAPLVGGLLAGLCSLYFTESQEKDFPEGNR